MSHSPPQEFVNFQTSSPRMRGAAERPSMLQALEWASRLLGEWLQSISEGDDLWESPSQQCLFVVRFH